MSKINNKIEWFKKINIHKKSIARILILALIFFLTSMPFTVVNATENIFGCKVGSNNIVLESSGNKFIISRVPKTSWNSNILKINDYPLTYVFKDKGSDYNSWLFPSGKDCKVKILKNNNNIVKVKIIYKYVAPINKPSSLTDDYSISITAEIKKGNPFIFINAVNKKKNGNFGYEGSWFVSNVKFSEYTFSDKIVKKMPKKGKWLKFSEKWGYFKSDYHKDALGLISENMYLMPTPKLYFSRIGNKWRPVKKTEINMDFAVGAVSDSKDVETAYFKSLLRKKNIMLTKSENSKEYFCTRVKKPMVMDGVLDDWENIEGRLCNNVKSAKKKSKEKWKGKDDLLAKFYTAYDDKFLYIAIDVNDNVYSQKFSGRNVYGGDGIQFAFDTLNNKMCGIDPESSCEYGLTLVNGTPEVFCWIYPDSLYSGIQYDIKSGIKKKKNGMIYEIAFPWHKLGAFRLVFEKMGFNFAINDDDGSGRNKFLGWTEPNNITKRKDASSFGTLIFEPNVFNARNGTIEILTKSKSFLKKNKINISILFNNEKKGNVNINFQVLKDANVIYKKTFKNLKEKTGKLDIGDWLNGNIDAGKYILKAELINNNTSIGKYEKQIMVNSVENTQHGIDLLKERFNSLNLLLKNTKNKGFKLFYQTAALRLIQDFIDISEHELGIIRVGHYKVFNTNRNKIEVINIKESRKLLLLDKVNRDLAYLNHVAGKTRLDIINIVKGSQKDFDVKKVPSGKVSIKDGTFICNDRPYIFVGPCSWSCNRLTAKDMPAYKDYGFNLVDFLLFKNTFKSSKQTFPKHLYHKKLDLDIVEETKKQGVFINLRIDVWGLKKSLMKSYADNYSNTLKNIKTFLNTDVYEKFFKHPNLLCYTIFPEFRFCDLTDASVKAFRNYLEKKYKTIAALNAAFNTDFADFNKIEVKFNKANQPVIWEWNCFNNDRINKFAKHRYNSIRKYDKTTPMFGQFELHALWAKSYLKMGFSREDLAEIMDILGCDSYGSSRKSDDYCASWVERIFGFDLLKSFAPKKPIFDAEYHITPDFSFQNESFNYIKGSIWQALIHGEMGFSFWLWDKYNNSGWNCLTFNKAESFYAISKTALDLNRLAPYGVEFQKEKRDIALLYAVPSIFNSPYLWKMRSCYEGLFFLGEPIGFISQKQIAKGLLGQYKTLIIAGAKRINDSVVEEIVKYLNSGGNVVLVGGQNMSKNELGIPRNKSMLMPIVNHKNTLFLKEDSPLNYFSWFQKNIPLKHYPVKFTDVNGKKIFAVECRTVKKDGKWIVFLMNLSNKKHQLKLKSKIPVVSIKDLIADREISKSELVLKPHELFLLELE